MRRYFREHRRNGGILRQSVLFLLACLLFVTGLPAEQRAKAADPITTAACYEWKQIKTQADIPAKGTYPMLLCYTDLNGNDWFLTGHDLKDDKYVYRDGIGSKKDSASWPSLVKNRYQAWLEGNGLTDSTANKGKYLKEYPAEAMLVTQYQDAPLGTQVMTNYLLSVDAGKYPEIALHSDSFYTKSLPSDWEMVVTGEIVYLKTIRIKSGNQYMFDDWKSVWNVDGILDITWTAMAACGWTDDESDATDYSVYTKDYDNERRNWTLDGYVQIFYDELGVDTGLCWDNDRVGGIEKNSYHYSNFKLYYAVTKEFSVIDRDYTITSGSILYAKNNLELMPDVTLTIEPGGVLSVTGVFFNDGDILNYGTMILNPGAVVTPLETKRTRIFCYDGDSYGSDCGSELILLEGATLIFPNHSDSKLYLYEGATCSNSGVIVAPSGIGISGGELVNRKAGHLFIGYYFKQALGINTKPTVVNAGKSAATIAGLKAVSAASSVRLELWERYHVRNDGTLLMNGHFCGSARSFEPGSRFYDKCESYNRSFYQW